MLTQIYEVSGSEEAKAISAIGINHVGVLVGDGRFPREQSIADARRIAAAIVPPSKLSALFLSADISMIEFWARELGPAIVHLGAAPELLSPEDVAALKSRLSDAIIMRSIPVCGEESLALARSYDGIADFLLLGSHTP
jgi:phosphoribosylanthranilate isomerase